MKNWLYELIATFRAPVVSVAVPAHRHTAPRVAAQGIRVRSAVITTPCVAHADSGDTDDAGTTGDSEVALFAWLVERDVDPQAALGEREQQTLLRLDQLETDTNAQTSLLPRAAAVVPRLLAQLRGPATSLSKLSHQVSRDMTLVAEVIRMANSAKYRQHSAVVELEQAIRVLGIDGLRFAIAKAVLKPLIDGRGGEFATRAAARLWQHTDCKSQLTAALALTDGRDPFDGYLLALAHNGVWSAVLRTMDSAASGAAPWRFSAGYAKALGSHRDRLVKVVARQWQLTDELSRAASEVAQRGLAAANSSAPVRALRLGDHLANLLCAHDSATAQALAEPVLASRPNSVRQCFLSLAQTSHDTTA